MREIKLFLKVTGHTLDTAAAALGVSRSSLANYATGRNRTHGNAQKTPDYVLQRCIAILRERNEYLRQRAFYLEKV